MDISWLKTRGFLLVGIPAALGGAVWNAAGLPLGWLMGAAVVAGTFAVRGRDIKLPKPLYQVSLAVIGASVGLFISRDVATQMLSWLPMMIGGAIAGMLCAAIAAPLLARWGKMSDATAFFSLLPGGVIEMANISEPFGGDKTTIAALHAVRVGLVVGVLPLVLFQMAPGPTGAMVTADQVGVSTTDVGIVLAVGLLGGWIGARLNLPASWLLGAVLSVGALTAAGVVEGRLPSWLLVAGQIVVGISLGARFQRNKLASIPRSLAVGTVALLLIITLMAGLAAVVGMIWDQPLGTMVLSFSIGGMAEMVLTAKAFEQNVALVAAFQAVRGVTVNTLAGTLWSQLSKLRKQI